MEAESPGVDFSTSTAEAVDLSALQDALESILSKKNLVSDQFLAGSMNPQMYIAIPFLLTHQKIRDMNATEADIAVAAERSSKLGVDEKKEMVRPLLKAKRNVVILRDVPADVVEADIRFSSVVPMKKR